MTSAAGCSRDDIRRLAVDADATDLPALVGAFAEAYALALARLTVAPERPAPREDTLLTMPQVASRLGITEHQAREMGRRGELPSITVGERFVRVRSGALEEWIRRRENGRTIRRRGQR